MILLLLQIIQNVFLYFIGWTNYDQLVLSTMDALIRHNVIFIKVFQALSSNQFFSHYFNNHLKDCTNHARFLESDEDTELLSNILQTYGIELFEKKPINAGMIALAYKGKIKEQKVILKMKRKNIEERLIVGYAEFKRFYNLLQYIGFFFGFTDMLNSISSFIETENYIISQCDFDIEINTMKQMKREITKTYETHKIKSLDKIVVPQVFNLETENKNQFIIMEYLEGETCFDVLNKYDSLFTLTTFVYTNIFLISLLHTDLHPGNIICMADGNIGIIDFGMSVVITQPMKLGFIGIAQILMSDDPKADYLKCFTHMVEPHLDISILTVEEHTKINSILADLFINLFHGKLTEYDIQMYLKKIFNSSKKVTDYKISIDCFKMLLGFTMYNASVFSLTKDTNTIKEIQTKILEEIFM
jgi:predicted unusual protein kinase regulating ubiquinone biosynthesis (AarF/ABC1/UbiB family)